MTNISPTRHSEERVARRENLCTQCSHIRFKNMYCAGYIGFNGENYIKDDSESFNLYAKWTSASVTLPTPTRTGYIFNGWYTAASGGTKVGAGGSEYTPTSAITLYAQWTRITSEMLEYSNSTYTTCTTVECAINELYQY